MGRRDIFNLLFRMQDRREINAEHLNVLFLCIAKQPGNIFYYRLIAGRVFRFRQEKLISVR